MNRFLTLSLFLGLGSLATVAAQPPQLPTLQTFDYERGIEWGDYNPEYELTLARQADGSYLADYKLRGGPEAKQVPVQEDQLQELRQVLEGMRGFPDDSFAGEGNHWYTDFTLHAADPDGSAWQLKRWWFDSNSRPIVRQTQALEDAVLHLVKALAPPATAPAPQGGMTSALGAGS